MDDDKVLFAKRYGVCAVCGIKIRNTFSRIYLRKNELKILYPKCDFVWLFKNYIYTLRFHDWETYTVCSLSNPGFIRIMK